jgi:hypothetical protein
MMEDRYPTDVLFALLNGQVGALGTDSELVLSG